MQSHRCVDRNRRPVGDLERAGREPDRLPTADRTSFVPIRVRHGRADAVAVEDRGDDAAVQDVRGPRHVLGPRTERRDRDLGIICRPPAFEPEAGRVVGTTAPAVVERHQVLERIDDAVGRPYSHSIVPGGLEVMSYATRFTPGTSRTMRCAIRSRTSCGRRAQSAVIASSDVTTRTTTGFS